MKELMRNKKKKKKYMVEWLVAFLLILSLLPYFVWRFENLSIWFITLPLFLFFLTHTRKPMDAVALIGFAFISVWGAICRQSNFLGIVVSLTTAFIFAVEKTFLISVYNKYRFILIVLLSLSLVVFFLISFGVSLPYYVSPPPPRNTIDYNYYIYPFYACPSVDDWRNLGLNRFNALFDESGVVGTISFMILFIEHFNFKRFGNFVFLLSGIFSFSLFFYIISGIYLSYHFLFERSKMIYKVIVVLIFSISLIQFAKTELFQGYIGNRLLWDTTTQTIVGDDRSGVDLKNYVRKIRGTADYFFGSPEKVSNYQSSASLEKQVLSHGFLTIAFFFIFFAAYSHRYLKNTKEWLLFYVVFCAVMYNRPSMFAYGRLFLFCNMIFAWAYNYKELYLQLGMPLFSKSKLFKSL